MFIYKPPSPQHFHHSDRSDLFSLVFFFFFFSWSEIQIKFSYFWHYEPNKINHFERILWHFFRGEFFLLWFCNYVLKEWIGGDKRPNTGSIYCLHCAYTAGGILLLSSPGSFPACNNNVIYNTHTYITFNGRASAAAPTACCFELLQVNCCIFFIVFIFCLGLFRQSSWLSTILKINTFKMVNFMWRRVIFYGPTR